LRLSLARTASLIRVSGYKPPAFQNAALDAVASSTVPPSLTDIVSCVFHVPPLYRLLAHFTEP